MMKCKVEKFEVEKKSFQVKFERSNGGTWVSVTERSRGFVVSVGFGREEVDWLTEHLKKAVELENTRGFTRKFRGENKIHLMEICFNNRGRFMKITEIAIRRKPLLLVIPEGVKGGGWEVLRRAILSVQDYSDQVGEELKKMFGNNQMSNSIYRGGRLYAEVVAEDGIRSGVPLSTGKWARAVIWVFLCEYSRKSKMVTRAGESFSERKACSPKKMVAKRKYDYSWKIQKGLVSVERPSFSLVGGRPAEIHLEEVGEGDGGSKGSREAVGLDEVAVSVIGEEGEDGNVTSETSHCRYEWLKEGGCVSQTPKFAEGYKVVSGVMSATVGSFFPGHVIGVRVQAWRPKGRRMGRAQFGLSRRRHSWPIVPESSTKAHPRHPFLLHSERGSSAKATTQPRSGDERAGVEVILGEDGWANEFQARLHPTLAHLQRQKRSREEESVARKGKAPMDQMEDFTQGEKTMDSREMWSKLFLPARLAVMDNGCSSKTLPLQSAASLCEVHNLEVDGGMGSQQIRGIRESLIFRCFLPRKCNKLVEGRNLDDKRRDGIAKIPTQR
ncbi:hypothetical protein CK203_052727 [Vitis vinifera]|uniref:DUF4283 domain-containing protein n=1 Tax=Vitis vinifera TaxID=29760 RepID=A0A438GCQ5_VITVI|nr:hypothetical protein CK203_052727 [Vitis vinifera]